MAKISIIIPVYNVENKMDNCLNSLNSQTNDSFEVVFVEDCSSDNSYTYLENWLSNNAMFKYKLIQNKKNSGPGYSRNNGINNSSYPYVSFLDSDDILDPNFVEKSIDIITSNINIDLIIYDYYMKKGETNTPKRSCLVKEHGLVSPIDVLALCSGMCWGKVYNKKLINSGNVHFANLIRSEDLVFVKKYVNRCRKIYYCNERLYYYVQNNTSIMHQASTLSIDNNIKAFEEIKKIGNNEAIRMVFLREYLYLITQILILKKEKTKTIKDFIRESKKMYTNCFKNKYLSYQPMYLKVILFLIRLEIIWPLRIIFRLKEK